MRQETTGFLEMNAGFVAVAEPSLLKALDRVVACEACSVSAFRSFGSVLSITLGAERPASEYLLGVPAFCPSCQAPIAEDTLVRFDGDSGDGGTETLDSFPGAIPAYTPWWVATSDVAVQNVQENQAGDFVAEQQQAVIWH